MAHPDAPLTTDPTSGFLRPRRRSPGPAAAEPDAGQAVLATTGAATLLLFMATLLIPATFQAGGLNLPLYRILLIVLLVPLSLRFLREADYRVNAVDVLVLGYIAWTGLSVYANHGMARIVYIGSTAIDQYGAYLIGRMLIRHALDYRTFINYFVGGLILLLPLALLEFFFQRFPLQNLIASLGLGAPRVGGGGGDRFMGFPRVRTVMPHAILFGIVCGIAVANAVYVYRSFWRKWPAFSLASLLTLMSLSTTPTIGLLIQFCLIAWDKLLRSMRGKWILGGIFGALGLAVLQVSAEGGIVGFFINEVAWKSSTGWGRLEIIEYTSAEIARHPVFGIGFNDWVRPFWRGTASVDTFWFATAMRFGLPTILFFIAAVAVHLVLVMLRKGLDEEAANYRKGYLIAWGGLLFGLTFVNFWGAPNLFVLTYIGAGVWFYDPRTAATTGGPARALARAAAADGRGRSAPPESAPQSGPQSGLQSGLQSGPRPGAGRPAMRRTDAARPGAARADGGRPGALAGRPARDGPSPAGRRPHERRQGRGRPQTK